MPSEKIDYAQVFFDEEPLVDGACVGKSRPLSLSVQIRNHGKPDCQVGHFGHNFYVRTRAGMDYREYKSRAMLKREVNRKLARHGFKVIRWASAAEAREYG